MPRQLTEQNAVERAALAAGILPWQLFLFFSLGQEIHEGSPRRKWHQLRCVLN
jgi:hypothetical protein